MRLSDELADGVKPATAPRAILEANGLEQMWAKSAAPSTQLKLPEILCLRFDFHHASIDLSDRHQARQVSHDNDVSREDRSCSAA